MSKTTKASLLLALTAIMWSIGGLFIKMVNWHPLAIAGMRSLIASTVFIAYLVYKKEKLMINKKTLLCGLALAATMLLFVCSNKLTTSANAVVLQSSSPVHIIWISCLFYKQRYTVRDYIAVGITMGGIILFFCDSLTPGNLLGNILALISGVTMATMTVLTNRLPDSHSASSALMLGHIFTALVGLPFLLAPGNEFTGTSFLCLAVLGIVQLGIPYLLYGLCAQSTPPLLCSLIVMLEPLLNPVWVFLAVGELPGLFALIGGVIVLVTVTVWCIGSTRTAAKAKLPA